MKSLKNTLGLSEIVKKTIDPTLFQEKKNKAEVFHSVSNSPQHGIHIVALCINAHICLTRDMTVVYNCFFAESGQAKQHRRVITLHAV